MRPLFSIRNIILGIVLGTSFLVAAENGEPGPWKFETGIGFRNTIPVTALAGVSYRQATFRLQGLGVHQRTNDYWCGIRGSLLWNLFYPSPFSAEVGIGGGYDFAEAPNEMHKALNKANNAKYVYPYNYKENADISLEIWTHIFGVYTQVSVPVYQFMDHDVPRVLWGAGYLVTF